MSNNKQSKGIFINMDNFNLKKYLVENKVTTNSKLTNEESPTQTTSYKKFMDVFNLVKNKGEVNELGNGYILKNLETKSLYGGMSRLIQWENFEAHMDYFDEITYKNGDENTLNNILINVEKNNGDV